MITTRKEYAERLKVTERTIKNWMEAVGIDTAKATLTQDEVSLLDWVKSQLDAGCKMAEIVENVKQIPPPPGENPIFSIIQDEVLGRTIDAAIPHIPEWTVAALVTRKKAIKAAFELYFGSNYPLETISSEPPPAEPDLPSLPSSSENN